MASQAWNKNKIVDEDLVRFDCRCGYYVYFTTKFIKQFKDYYDGMDCPQCQKPMIRWR